MNTQSALESLANVVGKDHILDDPSDLAFFSADLFIFGVAPRAVIAPGTRAELSHVVRLCNEAGLAVLPRGGGLSYTAGYVQDDPNIDAVVLDTRRLNKIIDVNPENLTITAESGCTWEQISEAAAAHGLRASMPGPTTGRYSTLGGSLSNNCMFFNSAKTGTAADTVVGMDIVAADGTAITTGSGAIENGVPFFRNNGPDITSLFISDAGSLGIKAAATLRLEPIPAGTAFASVAFATFDQMIPAIQAVGRSGLAAECLAAGPIAKDGGPTLHITVEGWTQDIADAQLAVLLGLIGTEGTTQDPVIPQFMREHGFGFVQSPIDPKGRLQIWTHGVVAIGQTLETYLALRAVLDKHQDSMNEHGIEATMSFACAGIAMMVEPVLYWASTPSDLHCSGMADTERDSAVKNAPADALVREIRVGIRAAYDSVGAAHMQYGRFYAYGEVTQKNTVTLVERIKAIMDPKRNLNPGALGL